MSPVPINPVAARIYGELAPLAYAEAENGYALLRFIEAWTNSMAEIDALVRDGSDGSPGWRKAMDVDTAPDKFLDFLAQFVGIEFTGGETPAQKRDIIYALVNLRRGSPVASRAWVQRNLTGTKYMIFNERSGGSAYRYSVRVKASEAPASDVAGTTQIIYKGLLAHKPAGVTLDFGIITSLTYGDINAGYQTYTASYTGKADYFAWDTTLP